MHVSFGKVFNVFEICYYLKVVTDQNMAYCIFVNFGFGNQKKLYICQLLDPHLFGCPFSHILL